MGIQTGQTKLRGQGTWFLQLVPFYRVFNSVLLSNSLYVHEVAM